MPTVSRRPSLRRAAPIGAALALGALAGAPALASRPASPAQAEFIIQAVETSPLTKKIPVSDYSVRRIRVSSVNPRYASAMIQANPKARNRVQSVVTLLRQGPGGKWRLLDLDAISCGLAPRRVLNDLFGGCIPR
jgi:hypothetical protein